MSTPTFKQVQEHCEHLKNEYLPRNKMYDEVVKMFMMKWDEEAKMRNDKRQLFVTLSPNARNAVIGAVRLMIPTDPAFKIPKTEGARFAADKLETAADTMWKATGRMTGNPLHFDMILSGILFSEVHTTVSKMSDMVKRAQGGSPGYLRMLEERAEQTPYLVESSDPRMGYPELTKFGMRAFYKEIETSRREVIDTYGSKAAHLEQGDANPFDRVTLKTYYDLDNVWIWTDEDDAPIVEEEHQLPFIPVNCAIIEGSQLFDKKEDQRQPFLYTMLKSKIWNRQNLLLTVMYDLIFKMGVNPQVIFKGEDEDEFPTFDFNQPMGMVKLHGQQEMKELKFDAVDPQLMEMWNMAENLGTESTIYKQALGQAIGGSSATFSLQSLLSQAGRLPLVWPQKKLSWAISDVSKMMLKWIKADGKKTKAHYGSKAIEIEPGEIPEYFEMTTNLKIQMPQDMMQSAQIATMLTQGDRPLTSIEYAREEYLNVGDSDKMEQEIWNEMWASNEFISAMQEDAQRRMQANQPPAPGPNGMTQEVTDPNLIPPNPEVQEIGQKVEGQLAQMGVPQDMIDQVMRGELRPDEAVAQFQQMQREQGGA